MKDITGYEGLYAIEEDGRVWSYKSNQYIKQWIGQKNGYYMVRLHKNGNAENKCVHRLLAEAYIENPENKETVDHRDRNKLNNELSNLRWATREEQRENEDDTKIRSIASNRCKTGLANPLKPVIAINKITKEETRYNSLADAARALGKTDKQSALICQAAKGTKPSAYGYYWRYE